MIFIVISAIIVVIALAFIIPAVMRSGNRFVCSKCGSNFGIKWYKLIFTEMSSFPWVGRNRLMKCPNCGVRNECRVIYD